ncbi:MAG: glycoside hydrolase family 43 protein [Microbacterium hominis]|jgi:hypothetical protein|uniref:glycoside hydrolase family 43 protein n=1 Tax=Microbacterium aurum TaxID=36805 RepID=UPI000DB54F16|nr:glycoside hydrolase family 43 protein [Microbacterium aurum]MBZ6372273.1 glycoside hydrolase family 43 protein [Microbacterium hominis]PZU43568.1 MAG: hypothetical protein DI566_14335 [Microbacterium sp.]
MGRYGNPIARNGDFADPFVLRHDGLYYLYATNPDVRCWSSRDLVNWTLEGPTIAPDVFPGLVPFAPEVVYDDGVFHMYTSPSGFGHVVLSSASPTGPFEPVSPNVGHAIDGHVFVDDDGARYFYWAGDEGIWGCRLLGADGFGEPVLTGIHMNGWTEGPFVLKRDGLYYMTLTGNHYLSPGYRIDAAWSDDPLRGWRGDPLNPILVSTTGDLVGLGHSSSVIGPDLVSTWIAYHNFNPDASRDLDLDRQVHSGRSLQVLGPTRSARAPEPPDERVDWSDSGADQWAVEAGELAVTNDRGVLTGGQIRARWRVDPGPEFTAELCLTGGVLVLDGTTVPLPPALDIDVLHTWRVESRGAEARVLVDARLAGVLPSSPSTSIAIEGSGSVHIGSVSLTRRTPDAADRASLKPVPGRFWAALGTDGPTAVDCFTDDVMSAERIRIAPGASIHYELDVPHPGPYRVHVSGDFDAGTEMALDIDGARVPMASAGPSTLVSCDAVLSRPTTLIRLEGVTGTPIVDLVTVAPMPHPGPPEVTDKRMRGIGKRVLPGRYDDVELAARVVVEFDADDAHADLLVRADQLSEGGEGDDPMLGTDFLLGYSVQLHANRVVLARHDYRERVLGQHLVPVDPSIAHDLVVRCLGGSLSVELDGRRILDVDDALPHVLGHVGMRTWNAHLHVESLRVVPGGRSRAIE